MRIVLGKLIRALAAGALLSVVGIAAGQSVYPTKPIRVVVPYPPGGVVDTLLRILEPPLTRALGQSLIVDYQPGGGTVIGARAAARAAPDGYTIYMTSVQHVAIPSLMQPSPFDVIKDFAPIGTVAATELFLMVPPGLPATTLQEFIALAGSRPGGLNYASSGIGSASHLAGELFNLAAGVRMVHVPYKGAGPLMVDLMGGQVDATFNVNLPHLRSGKLKAIAVSGEKRHPALPDVPTFAESGLPGLDLTTWYGLLAPSHTPSEAIERLSAALREVLAQPAVKAAIAGAALEPFFLTPRQFAERQRSDLEKFARVIRAANIRLE